MRQNIFLCGAYEQLRRRKKKNTEKTCPRFWGKINTGRVFIARSPLTRSFWDKSESGIFLPASVLPILSEEHSSIPFRDSVPFLVLHLRPRNSTEMDSGFFFFFLIGLRRPVLRHSLHFHLLLWERERQAFLPLAPLSTRSVSSRLFMLQDFCQHAPCFIIIYCYGKP